MKLFEYTASIEVRTAIAAESLEEADAMWSEIYRPDFPEASRLVSADISEIVEVSDGELAEIREPSRKRCDGESLDRWLNGDAHVIVPHAVRLDREGRDVTDLPGLWDEGDLMKASVTT